MRKLFCVVDVFRFDGRIVVQIFFDGLVHFRNFPSCQDMNIVVDGFQSVDDIGVSIPSHQDGTQFFGCPSSQV